MMGVKQGERLAVVIIAVKMIGYGGRDSCSWLKLDGGTVGVGLSEMRLL